MARVAILGGGLAGLAAASALGSSGYDVDLYESRAFLGGRATSWPVGAGDEAEMVDNCQHVLLRCCVNLLDLYGRLGVGDKVRFHKEFCFIEPGGRRSYMKRGMLPAPAHFAGSFLTLKYLGFKDKLCIARAMNAIPRELRKRRDLDQISMLDWLREHRQTERAIERYWRQVLVSAINEELDRMAASHGFQVFWLGMIARADSYEMGVPDVPLRELYDEHGLPKSVTIHERAAVTAIDCADGAVDAVVAGANDGWRTTICPVCRSSVCVRCCPICRWNGTRSGIRPSPASISGSTGRSPICRMPRCWTARFSGSSTRAKAGMCNWW